MEHKLVEKLKNAGFPFDFKESKLGDDTYTYPSLEELIDECGEYFDSLYRRINPESGEVDWVAYSSDKSGMHGYGKTKKEAVVNLWLKFNKK